MNNFSTNILEQKKDMELILKLIKKIKSYRMNEKNITSLNYKKW